MKLIRLYSKTGLISEIIFKSGLNVILGKYSTKGKDINGIGKTTIVDMIDFCLLADGPKHNYRKEKFSFLKKHTISLEVMLWGEPLVLTKCFDDLNKVLVKSHQKPEVEYSDVDYRAILGKAIFDEQDYCGVAEPEWYRTIMSFFVQNDHSFFQRDSRDVINFVNYGLRKPELISFLFFLIGYDNRHIYEYDRLQVNQKLIQSDHNRVVKNIQTATGKGLTDFKADIDSLDAKITQFEEQANGFQFFDINRDIGNQLEVVQGHISTLQAQYFEIEHKLGEVKRSISFGVDIDLKRVRSLYNELNSDFSSFIVRTLDEVQAFRAKIVQNRRRFLVERELEYSASLEKIKQAIVGLEQNKKSLYAQLKQPRVLDDIKSAYSFLGDIKTKREQSRVLRDELDRIELDSSTNKKQITDSINEIVRNKSSLDEALKEVKSIFFDVVQNSVVVEENDLPTHLLIEPRANIKSPISIDIQVPRSGSLGKDRFKILAFDLTVFLTTIRANRLLPTFLVHDGVFHGIAHKTRIRYLNYVNTVFQGFDSAQYIITLNEDEISLPVDYDDGLSHLNFDLASRVIKVVEDSPQSMLFGMEF